MFTVLAEEKGVYQASGYGDLAPDKSVWSVSNSGVLSVFSFFHLCSANRFWFFAARHDPDKAPLITWFNGGVSDTVRHLILHTHKLYQPGSSSMLGLFQENGPCRINNDSLGVHHNPMSWNEFANV
jgi:Serine carboxypeptidase